MNKDLAQDLAGEYVRLHNEATPKFQAAFVKIGARMWRMDYAHPLKKKSIAFIANTIQGYLDRGIPEAIREVYGHALDHPLTVMDSYPQCRKYHSQLSRDVKKIWEEGNERWSQFLKERGI